MLNTELQYDLRAGDGLETLLLDQPAGCRLRRRRDGSATAEWFGCELSSAFQPIVDPLKQQVAGIEAFLRIPGSGDRKLSPWNLFSSAADDHNLVALDRLCRALHLLNALAAGHGSLVFLNVHGRLLATVGDDHGKAFRRVVDTLKVDPARVVIETPLMASDQPDLLAFVLRNYQANGFKVAVNVDAATQWRLISNVVQPDFVKIDGRSLGSGEDGALRLHRLADELVGASLIVTRLEQPLPLSPIPGLWLQGYAYGHPVVLRPVPRFLRW
jgi:EAL domain-containing protein (putative c-di-GMP-specific phosphodiesterase class I)